MAAEAYALHEGAFGTAIVLELQADLVAHAHSETQIAFWLGGSRACARVGSETVYYSEDVALGANAFESHDMTLLDNSGSCLFLAFMISSDWLAQRECARGRKFRLPSPHIPIDANLRQSCWRVLDLILSGGDARASVDDEVERLLEVAIESASALPSDKKGGLGISTDHRLRAAIAHMRDNVSAKATIDEIATKVGLSRAHFFALFRDQLNTTPQVFWSAVKVEEAMRRVAQGGALTEVALDLGFSAPGNFSRFFKEHTGVSPSIFRRAVREPLPATVTGFPH